MFDSRKFFSKRSEHVYIEEFEYRSEANRFDSDFVFKKTKKSELSFFLKTKGKKRKGSIVNYRSFAIPTTYCRMCSLRFENSLLTVGRVCFVSCNRHICTLYDWVTGNTLFQL